MMLEKKPEMIREAAAQSQGRPLWQEIPLFLLVMLVAGLFQSTLSGFGLTEYLLQSAPFQAIMQHPEQFSNLSQFMEQVNAVTTALPDRFMLQMLFATVAITATCIGYCKLVEGRGLRSMGFRREKAVRQYLAGWGIGAGMFCAVILIGMVCGAFRLGGISGHAAIGMLCLFFLGYLLQGMSEEVLCRGYLMVSIARRHTLPVAVLTNALLFSALHLMNPGITPLAFFNITLFGVFASVYMLRQGSIWGVAALHAAWNFMQGNVFGASVSGTVTHTAVFSMELSEGRTLVSGGAFGPEGGLAVTAVLAAGIAVLLLWRGKEIPAEETAGRAQPHESDRA